MVEKYSNSTDTLSPHIYTVANEALKNVNKISQSIVIMGESGSGKTESTKNIIQFLCNTGEKKLMDALTYSNLVLEAFGNSKTPKNNNSSRYSKYVKVNSFNCV